MQRHWSVPIASLPWLMAGALSSVVLGGCRTPSASALQGLPVIPPHVQLQFGDDVGPAVRARITALMTAVEPTAEVLGSSIAKAPIDASDPRRSILRLSFGDTPLTRTLIDQATQRGVGPEGFVVRSSQTKEAMLIAGIGNPAAAANLAHGTIGTSYAAYAVLEQLGFAFLRPLAPTVPKQLHLPVSPLNLTESPRWRVRAMHLHTQHPLELTDLLQGWGDMGPNDLDGWQKMLPDWDLYLEWLLANRQNRVEWALLWAKSWSTFADSEERQGRMRQIVERAHAHGIAAGVDVPLTLQQQHAYHLVRTLGNRDDEVAQLHQHIDWLMGSGFDFLSTETGTSEFTHPSPEQTLAWMNEFSDYLWSKHGKPAYIKIHCSTGQIANGYPDPRTGQPINFNMLPHFASTHLGVLPHTVQHYGLDDPAPTYGNQSFAYMRDFLAAEVGTREVLWYPETSYWVSFDIDVPLFLPIYANRRVHDLRLLAGDEAAKRLGRGANAGKLMDGQLNFSSGWEWGYWLNDVIAARAAWNPALESASDQEALTKIASPALTVFGATAPDVLSWVNRVASQEYASLIQGIAAGTSPKTVALRNGQAYLQGFDVWDDVSALATLINFKGVQMTQPAALGLVSLRGPDLGRDAPRYDRDLAPLLRDMNTQLNGLALEGKALRMRVPAAARPLMDDLADAAAMTALRAAQKYGLYDYVALSKAGDVRAPERLKNARQALDDAARIVKRREAQYAMADRERIAGWRPGPTAYEYRYLWTVRSLYYWWRDEGKAVDAPRSPCYLNIINAVDVGFGEGALLKASENVGKLFGGATKGCIDAPAREPQFPFDGLRTRP